MIFKYELRFVAFTWPNVGLDFVSGICKLKPGHLKNLKPKNLKNGKNTRFLPALMFPRMRKSCTVDRI